MARTVSSEPQKKGKNEGMLVVHPSVLVLSMAPWITLKSKTVNNSRRNLSIDFEVRKETKLFHWFRLENK